LPLPDSNSDHSAVQPVASRYTEYAIPAKCKNDHNCVLSYEKPRINGSEMATSFTRLERGRDSLNGGSEQCKIHYLYRIRGMQKKLKCPDWDSNSRLQHLRDARPREYQSAKPSLSVIKISVRKFPSHDKPLRR
jgi:hypothetical protein